MLDIILVVAGLALVGVPAWLYLRREAEPARSEPRPSRRSASAVESAAETPARGSAFRAVSVRTGTGPCDAARSLNGKRFLGHEAPHLPLAGCDAVRCQCRYAHHNDRRFQPERRFPYSNLGRPGGMPIEERRSQGDRRQA